MDAQALFARFNLPRPEPLEGFPGGVWFSRLPAAQAYAGWQQLHDIAADTGWCPVVLDPSLAPDFYDGEYAEEQVGQALAADGRAVLEHLSTDGAPRNIRPGSGPLPPPAEIDHREPSGGAVLAAAPLTQPWLWPALLGYLGPVNLGIDPYEVAAVLHRWHDAFGAVPVTLVERTAVVRSRRWTFWWD